MRVRPNNGRAGSVRALQGNGNGLGQVEGIPCRAEAGSFTHAGESLNLSQSAVSRQISALEESLSVPLFHRHARGLILTEQGNSSFARPATCFPNCRWPKV